MIWVEAGCICMTRNSCLGFYYDKHLNRLARGFDAGRDDDFVLTLKSTFIRISVQTGTAFTNYHMYIKAISVYKKCINFSCPVNAWKRFRSLNVDLRSLKQSFWPRRLLIGRNCCVHVGNVLYLRNGNLVWYFIESKQAGTFSTPYTSQGFLGK